MSWCAKATKMQVRTNADTPGQVKNAVAFGATGIGLCRTEHMFFEGDRIDAVRQMILAENEDDRRKALKKLLPYQRKDFEGIFKSLNGLPGTIRLLDPRYMSSCRTTASKSMTWLKNSKSSQLKSRSE